MKSKKKIKKVFVSGCYDILHANHIRLFEKAKSFGDYLIVSFASDKVLLKYKGRTSAMPEKHKEYIIKSLPAVDEVVMGDNDEDPIFDFKDHFIRIKPNILVTTENDKYTEEKKKFCEKYGVKFIQIPEVLDFGEFRTTDIRNRIMIPTKINLRVDFAGGWLDVPKFSKKDAYIVNCTIDSPVSLTEWNFNKGSGLGGSAAHAILSGLNPIKSELDMGVGWQDPAVIMETGLCVWRSGTYPVLEIKTNPDFLRGKMGLFWTGRDHQTPNIVDKKRDFDLIKKAGDLAKDAVLKKDFLKLCKAVNLSYKSQTDEGMLKLPSYNELAKKYCGGGHGGYALYIFKNENERKKFIKKFDILPIEPHIKEY